MNKRIKVSAAIVLTALALEGWALYVVSASDARWRPALIVRDEPKAHALYDAMVEAIQHADSLSYTSYCSGPDERDSTYHVWLKRPAGIRVELNNGASVQQTIAVYNGECLWIYWSGSRPYLDTDDYESYEKTKTNVYVEQSHGTDPFSMRDRLARLGIGWYEMILDPSLFHGHADRFEPYMDGIRSRGADKVGGQACDVIEVSYMQAQRIRYYWLSREDHLPRRIKEVVQLFKPQVTVEEWFDVTLDARIKPDLLTWTPPPSWRPFTSRQAHDLLLTPGRKAPDFEMRAIDGRMVRLLDYHGEVVWLYFWQVGEPLCRQQLPQIQSFYEDHSDESLEIIGIDVSDDEQIVKQFLQTTHVTFPILLDSSETARKIVSEEYRNEGFDVPLNYLVDPNGIILDAWFGQDQRQQDLAEILGAIRNR